MHIHRVSRKLAHVGACRERVKSEALMDRNLLVRSPQKNGEPKLDQSENEPSLWIKNLEAPKYGLFDGSFSYLPQNLCPPYFAMLSTLKLM